MSDALANPPPLKLSWFIGILGAFLVFVVIAAYSSRQAQDAPRYDQDRAAQRYATLAKLRAADHETLTTAAWIDQAKGVVRIPIDEAMPEEIVTLQSQPVKMAEVIPGTAPAAAAAPAPSATPATNAAPAATAPKIKTKAKVKTKAKASSRTHAQPNP